MFIILMTNDCFFVNDTLKYLNVTEGNINLYKSKEEKNNIF